MECKEKLFLIDIEGCFESAIAYKFNGDKDIFSVTLSKRRSTTFK